MVAVVGTDGKHMMECYITAQKATEQRKPSKHQVNHHLT